MFIIHVRVYLIARARFTTAAAVVLYRGRHHDSTRIARSAFGIFYCVNACVCCGLLACAIIMFGVIFYSVHVDF